jgi:ATP-dependent Lhr-like helicase
MFPGVSSSSPSTDDARHEKLRVLLQRFLQTRGPVTIAEILQRYPLDRQATADALAELARAGAVYHGQLTAGASEEQWCDRRNFEQLYRRAIQQRRHAFAPQPAEHFLRFLWRWHGIGQLQNPAQLAPLLQRLRGLFLPLHFLEREILCARLAPTQLAPNYASCHLQLASLCQQGELIWRLYQENKGHARLVQFYRCGEGHLFYSREQLESEITALSAPAKTVREFLKENGASFFRDLAAGSGLPKTPLLEALAELAWRGLVTNDSLQVLNELAEHGTPRPAESAEGEAMARESFVESTSHVDTNGLQEHLEAALPEWRKRSQSWRRRQYSRRREEYRRDLKPLPPLSEGRWSLAESFAIFGKPDSAERHLAQRQAMLLLERYGILVKEWYRREVGLLPWYAIFQALKQMEWRGEVRRGYFVEGLSGVQFALPHALEMFATNNAAQNFSAPVMLNALDPAVPFGSGVNLPLRDFAGHALTLMRQASNHLIFMEARPIIYAENYGARLRSLTGATDEQLAAGLGCLRQFLLLPEPLRPRKRIEVETWNDAPIVDTPAAAWLQQHGFEKEMHKLALWPSGLS